MYTQYFGLRENPFAIPPDPRYLYLSLRHQEALAHLMYGITDGGGFVQLTGEVGTGKTMMIRAMLERLPDNVDVALVLYPFLSVREFVVGILDDLRIAYPKDTESLKVLIDVLNDYLLENHAKGRRTVLIIDEAHKLSHEVLEQVRLLTNLETNKEKLLQILLVGQPELNSLLAQRDLRQLAQRITARYNLKALLPHESGEYVIQRLRVAGARTPFFTKSALAAIHRSSGGVPRLINVVCDRALLGAYAHGEPTINIRTVRRAARELGHSSVGLHGPLLKGALATAAAVLLGVGAWQLWPWVKETAFIKKIAVTTPTQTAHASAGAEAVNVAMNAADGAAAGETFKMAKIAAPAKAPSFEMALAEDGVYTDTDSAFSALFATWGKVYQDFAGATGCDRALKAGLRCLYRHGTWNNLRQLNRPAIIELIDPVGNRHHVLVTALQDDRVTVRLGDREQSFATAELDRHWYGKFLLLWSPPAIREANLRRGMRGEGVLWLREALSWYSGLKPITPTNETFDAALEAQVKEFQRQHFLDTDGVVGELTFLQLNAYNAQLPPPSLAKSAKRGTG